MPAALQPYQLLWTSTLIFLLIAKITEICGCSDREFSCGSGDLCIPLERLCDGVLDCPDHQDESFELCHNRKCTRNDFISGDPFRCDYGACIDQLFLCNGIANCADGSDETPQLCASKICRTREFQCDYGACINHRRKCDGERSCHYDGSDETLEACGDSRCRSDKFQCNYGACIFQRKKCDGKANCIDGSDESEDVCGSGHSVATITTTPTSVLTTVKSSPGTTSNPVIPVVTSSNNNEINIACYLTNGFEENVELDVLDCGAPGNMACNNSSEVPVLTTVLVNCWKTKRFLAQCHHDGLWHSYEDDGTPIFTPAKSLCQHENVNSPACGKHPPQEPYSLGSYLYQAPWPWLVGIFRKNKYYCTGTLITPHFVLTAAHCIARSQESSHALDIRDIKIQHYNFSDYGGLPEEPVQWISRIIIYPEFIPGRRPIHDVALVKLEDPVIFNKYTYPACVKTKDLEETLIGWTFNRTEGEENYSWVDFKQQMDPSCQTSATVNRAEGCDRNLNVHQHQFCAINNEIDQWLHPGSSGGPFLVNAGNKINQLWEVAGIVSSSVNDNKCDVPYTIFTDVSAYAHWIENCVNYDKCSLIN